MLIKTLLPRGVDSLFQLITSDFMLGSVRNSYEDFVGHIQKTTEQKNICFCEAHEPFQLIIGWIRYFTWVGSDETLANAGVFYF